MVRFPVPEIRYKPFRPSRIGWRVSQVPKVMPLSW